MTIIVPSKDQINLAKLLGLDISSDTFEVAAARLLDAVAISIGHEPPQQSSERQRTFAAALGHDVSTDTKRIASAKIGQALFVKNQEAISSLDLKPGDHVIRVQKITMDREVHVIEKEFIISSIQSNGRVFFKGGNGQGAWPTELKKHEG